MENGGLADLLPFEISYVVGWRWVFILVEVDAAVGEFAEGSLLLDLGGLGGILRKSKSLAIVQPHQTFVIPFLHR